MRASCVICSDLFDEINPIAVAKCGHVLHFSCLTLWLDQSKTCPHCRCGITRNDVRKLYFNFVPKHDLNSSMLENEISNLKTQLCEKNAELLACKQQQENLRVFVIDAENRAEVLQQSVYKWEHELSDLRMRIKSAAKTEAKLLKAEQMNAALTSELEHLNNVKTIVNGTQKDVEDVLKDFSSQSESAKQLATYCTCLKRELQKLIDSKRKLVELNSQLKRENCSYAAKIKFFEEAMAISSNNVGKSCDGTPAKKLTKFNAKENYPIRANTPASSSSSPEVIELDVSPLSVAFSKNKFNVCIKSSVGAVHKSDAGSEKHVKDIPLMSLPGTSRDNNSVMKTGYNGLGGHSNFIVKSGITLKNKTILKRKL